MAMNQQMQPGMDALPIFNQLMFQAMQQSFNQMNPNQATQMNFVNNYGQVGKKNKNGQVQMKPQPEITNG